MLLAKVATPRQVDLALLALRVSTGLTMAAHGYQKVFVMGVPAMTQAFSGMGIPMAGVAAPLVSYLEVIGGVLVAIGFLTRPLALMLAIDMFVAASFVHLKNGFYLPAGAEFTLLFMMNFLALSLTGAGSYSVDAALRTRKE